MATAYRKNSGWRGQAAINGKRKTKKGFTTKLEVMAWSANKELLAKESAFSKASCRSSHLIVPSLEKISLRGLRFECCVASMSDSSGLFG